VRKIKPCIWFDHEAEEAARFYASVFRDATVGNVSRYDKASAAASGQPEGSALTVEFEIAGTPFLGLNGGPIFKPNPSVSFLVLCDTREEVDGIWEQLSEGGTPMMPLGEYPFSGHYGWMADRYGVSWQIMLGDEGAPVRERVTPTLMFTGDVAGRAEEAMGLYASIFPEGRVGDIVRYPAGTEAETEGTVMHGAVSLAGQGFFAMDSARPHDFAFSEGVSFIVNCADQDEVDHFWEKLTADGGEESMCGWLKDRYGVSWQIIPEELPKLIKNPNAMRAMLEMRKINVSALRAAADA